MSFSYIILMSLGFGVEKEGPGAHFERLMLKSVVKQKLL
jgi:hypothetical protein